MAHITMNACDVITQCNKVISFIEIERTTLKQELEIKIRAKVFAEFTIKFPFIRKWNPSVKEYLNAMDMFDTLSMKYTLADCLWSEDYDLAKKLLMLASLGDPVIITDKDVSLWQSYN